MRSTVEIDCNQSDCLLVDRRGAVLLSVAIILSGAILLKDAIVL